MDLFRASLVSRAALLAAVLVSGCGQPSKGYFPLDAGHTWEYRLTVTTLDATTRQKQVFHNLGNGIFNGQPVAIREYPGGGYGYYRQDREGIVRVAIRGPQEQDARPDEADHYVIREPVQTGTVWELRSRLSLIESRTFEPRDRIIPRHVPVTLIYRIENLNDEITVPAGRFAGCLRIRASGTATVRVDRGNNVAEVRVENIDWYAPGVGLVKSVRMESSDSTFLKPGDYLLELEYAD